MITHTPALGILDFDDGINYGSEEILMKLSDLHLKAHIFGHIHAKHGIIEQNGVKDGDGNIEIAPRYQRAEHTESDNQQGIVRLVAHDYAIAVSPDDWDLLAFISPN